MMDPNGATKKPQKYQLIMPLKKAMSIYSIIVDLTRFNADEYKLVHMLYKRFDDSTDTTVELIDKIQVM